MEENQSFSTNDGCISPPLNLVYHGGEFENNEIKPSHQSTQLLQTSSFMILVDNRLWRRTVRVIASQVQHDISNMELSLEHVIVTPKKESLSKRKIIYNYRPAHDLINVVPRKLRELYKILDPLISLHIICDSTC